jgi:hypothetical protein
MKHIRFIALSLLTTAFLSFQATLAQNTTFKLSDYKNPDYRYQTLDLNFGLRNWLNTNKINSTSGYTQNMYRFNSDAGATYSGFSNSRRSQSENHISLGAGISTSGSHFKQDQNTGNQDEKHSIYNYNESLDLSGLKRFYNEKQNYFEINASLGSGYSSDLLKIKSIYSGSPDTTIASSQNIFRNTVTGSFLIGNGRIEQVQDARLAMYLLDDLHRLSRDKRAASDEDVLALARLITSLKYKRFFDSRLRRIAEITAIDSFLQQSEIAGTTDAAYFTSLHDNWSFANNPARNSGHRFFTGLEADLAYNYTKSNQENQTTDKTISDEKDLNQTGSIFAVAGLICEKPLNLRWQRSASIKARFGSRYQSQSRKQSSTNGENNFDFYGAGFPAAMLSGDYGYGFYPNSRTWITANWDLTAEYSKQKTGTSRKDMKAALNTFEAHTGPTIQAYYYLSEKLRFSFAFDGELRLTDTKLTGDSAPQSPDNRTKTRRWTQNMNAALTYSLL